MSIGAGEILAARVGHRDLAAYGQAGDRAVGGDHALAAVGRAIGQAARAGRAVPPIISRPSPSKALLYPWIEFPGAEGSHGDVEGQTVRRIEHHRGRPVEVQHHAYRGAAGVGHGQIGRAVAVEVADHHALSAGAARTDDGRSREGTRAIAEEHRHVGGVVVRHGQIGVAVAVEVADGDALGPRPARADTLVAPNPPLPLPKRMPTVPVPEFTTARSALPSPLKSPTAMRLRASPIRLATPWGSWSAPESAAAIAQEDAYRASVAVGDGQVELAVAVEVGDGQGVGPVAARGERGSGPERAIAVAQKDAHRSAAVVGHGQIELAVAVEIGRDEGSGVVPPVL